MGNILDTFRGDPDNFEITRPMKYLLITFAAMFLFVLLSLYIMLQDISDQVWSIFFSLFIVDMVLMVVVDVLIILIWCPLIYRYCLKPDEGNPGCTSQCLPIEPSTSPQPSWNTPSNVEFRGLSVCELTSRLEDLTESNDRKTSKERTKSSPDYKAVYDVDVHKSRRNNSNLERNKDSPTYLSVHVSQPTEIDRHAKGQQKQSTIDQQQAVKKFECKENRKQADEVPRFRECKLNSTNLNRNHAFYGHISVHGVSEREYGYYEKPHFRVLTAPHQNVEDSKRNEIRINRHVGDVPQSGAGESNYYANLDGSRVFHRHFSVPMPPQKKEHLHSKKHHLRLPTDPQQSLKEPTGNDNQTKDDYAIPSSIFKSNESNLYQNRTVSGFASIPVLEQFKPDIPGLVKEPKNMYSTIPHFTDSEEYRMNKHDDVEQSNTCGEYVSLDQNRAYLRCNRPSQEDVFAGGQRKRFWTEPHTRTKDSKRNVAENSPNESINEIIDQMDNDLSKKYAKYVKPTIRSFSKIKRRINRDYMVHFSRGRGARSDIPPDNVDDALGLVPLSYDQSRRSSTADWVFSTKNVPPPQSDMHPTFKRSKSAPCKQRQTSSAARGDLGESISSNRTTMPASADDSRHRVLHRLLATILTTGDADSLDSLEVEDVDQDAPKMEVEALPSGDYVVHISMRLTSKELQDFKSRRATNIEGRFKGSAVDKYLASLC